MVYRAVLSRAVLCQVADEFLGVDEFYYPHTVDFRGRAYPLHPSLHHLGKAARGGGVVLGGGLSPVFVGGGGSWGGGE